MTAAVKLKCFQVKCFTINYVKVVSIGLILVFFMPFSYDGIYQQPLENPSLLSAQSHIL